MKTNLKISCKLFLFVREIDYICLVINYYIMTNKINNSVARFWTTAELKETIKQAKQNGFRVEKDKDFTKVFDSLQLILMSLKNGATQMVRLDKTYFYN